MNEKTVLCYLIEHSIHLGRYLICLARKKKKIGAGLWNGYGGHCEGAETQAETVGRELKEEGNVHLEMLNEIALVTYFERPLQVQYRDLNNYESKFQVYTFLGTSLFGKEPEETEEMGAPCWFAFDKIPYKEMMPADRFILPLILAVVGTNGRSFEADVYYGPEKKEVEWITIRPF